MLFSLFLVMKNEFITNTFGSDLSGPKTHVKYLAISGAYGLVLCLYVSVTV